MSKVLVICASYRLYSNSEILAAAFKEGAESAGHEVKKFSLRNMLVRPCRACDLCYSNGRPCVIEDDMDQLYDLIAEAEVIVMASPLYYFGFPAQLKAIIDRLYAPDVQAKLSKDTESHIDHNKSCILMMTAASEPADNFAIVRLHYQKIFEQWFRWKNLGTVFASGIVAPGDIVHHPAMEEARRLGASLK